MLKNKVLQNIFHVLPFIIIGASIVMVVTLADEFSVDYLLSFTPENHFRAVVFFLLLFTVKSFSLFLPITVLYILSGIVFPFVPSLLLNIAGTLICMTVGYCLGRFTSADYAEKMVDKYPKLKGVVEKLHQEEWFYSYLIRMFPIPDDLVSMYLGSMKIKAVTYFTAGFAGALPMIVAITLIGANINDPFSPMSVFAFSMTAALMLISYVMHRYKTQIFDAVRRKRR